MHVMYISTVCCMHCNWCNNLLMHIATVDVKDFPVFFFFFNNTESILNSWNKNETTHTKNMENFIEYKHLGCICGYYAAVSKILKN